ncbi:hypothetical protein AA106555_0918 [Neokomagataea thailandica NBRC 106555]|uniref:Uncharacterized protein n=1 Tax=Neokomagataea thailandica NBRC 106555 TaxID=1223520 RepID=A0ABQ0QPH7_9PROT|nr:hypothetical protein AA106555_0918 [Neokomagataea thailandica NBRC 106555]
MFHCESVLHGNWVIKTEWVTCISKKSVINIDIEINNSNILYNVNLVFRALGLGEGLLNSYIVSYFEVFKNAAQTVC